MGRIVIAAFQVENQRSPHLQFTLALHAVKQSTLNGHRVLGAVYPKDERYAEMHHWNDPEKTGPANATLCFYGTRLFLDGDPKEEDVKGQYLVAEHVRMEVVLMEPVDEVQHHFTTQATEPVWKPKRKAGGRR